MIGRDGLAGLAVAAASLALFWRTLGLETSPLVPIGPAFYPRIVLGITAVLGLALVALSLFERKKEKKNQKKNEKANHRLVALSFGAFALYVVALPFLGFRAATFGFVVAMNLLLSPPRSAAHWVRALVLGAITALATYYVFEHYLHVLLPRGSWTGF